MSHLPSPHWLSLPAPESIILCITQHETWIAGSKGNEEENEEGKLVVNDQRASRSNGMRISYIITVRREREMILMSETAKSYVNMTGAGRDRRLMNQSEPFHGN